MKKWAIVSCALLTATAGCAMNNKDGAAPVGSTSTMPTPTNAAAYVRAAGASDQFEIQSSQMALQKSQNPAVRQFAQMMISDHMKTTDQVMAAARAAGMSPPPPAMMPMQQNMVRQLQPLSGADFDRTYLQQQVQAHQMALELHQNFAQSGDNAQLRAAASTAVPIIQMHLDRVRQIAS